MVHWCLDCVLAHDLRSWVLLLDKRPFLLRTPTMGYVPTKLLLLLLCTLLAAVKADYIIDDADPIIRYTMSTSADVALLTALNGVRIYQGQDNGSAVIIDYTRLNNQSMYVTSPIGLQHHC